MNLLQSVLIVSVNFVDRKFLLPQGVNLSVLTEFDLPDVPRDLVVPNLLGVEVEESDLRLGLSGLSEEIIHLRVFALLEGDDPLEGVELD